MSNTEQKHYYYVDPGIGQKSRGCPYTFYKDGRDIRRYIRPPRGYELTNFKVESYDGDKFYDGKIVAQYRKMPLSSRIKKHPVAYLLSFLGIVGVLGILAYYFLDSRPEPALVTSNMEKPKTASSVPFIDSTTQTQDLNTFAIAEVDVEKEPEKEEIAQVEVIEEEVTEPVKEEVVIEEVTPIEKAAEPEEKEIISKSEPEQEQETQPTVMLTKEQFHQEFWSLIHSKESHMRTYGDLYRKYNSLNLKSKEFFYLYLTILENGSAFEVWNAKLLSIPDDELKSIHTISVLEQKIEEYQ